MDAVKNLFGHFTRQNRGSVAVMAGMTVPVVALAVGVSVSIVEVNRARVLVQNAADTAALSAANASSDQEISQAERRARAVALFQENLDYPTISSSDPQITFGAGERASEATVTASAELNLSFSGLLPSKYSQVSVVSKAAMAKASNHIELFFLVDNSASMGIGQTAQDRDDMLRDTSMAAAGLQPCAVACHTPGEPTRNTYPHYKAQGIRMRIDAVADALSAFLGRVRDGGSQTSRTKVNIRTTGDLDDVLSPTFFASHAEAVQAANALELEGRDGKTTTQIARSFEHIQQLVGEGGSGSSEDKAQKVVVLMTDGVEHGRASYPRFRVSSYSEPDTNDVYTKALEWLTENDPDTLESLNEPNDGVTTANNVYDWGVSNNYEDAASLIQILDPQSCQALKDQGATVIVMNVEYGIPEYRAKSDGTFPRYDSPRIPISDGGRDATLFDLKPNILPELQKCASSPDLVFSVEEEDEMLDAFEGIFSKVFEGRILRLVK